MAAFAENGLTSVVEIKPGVNSTILNTLVSNGLLRGREGQECSYVLSWLPVACSHVPFM